MLVDVWLLEGRSHRDVRNISSSRTVLELRRLLLLHDQEKG